jgi:hypothetical protein
MEMVWDGDASSTFVRAMRVARGRVDAHSAVTILRRGQSY